MIRHYLFTKYKRAGFVLILVLLVFHSCTVLDVVYCDDDTENVRSTDFDREPIGHLKPFGQHRDAEGFVDSVTGFLDPVDFFTKHVHENEPVIFKGAAQNMPAYKRWNDDYLTETYGQLSVSIEEGKKENRTTRSLSMPLSQFLQIYNTDDVYMVQDITEPFQKDLSLPPCLQCGGFERSLEVGVIWFSSGGTQSVLHHDDLDNINCVMDGRKRFILIDKHYDYLVEAEQWEREGTYSTVDVDAVNLNQFPSLAHVPWWQADIEAGDCLFIPYRWYHTVDSGPGRNLAVNLFFAHRLWLDEKECKEQNIDPKSDYESLENYIINSLHPESTAIEKMRCDVFEIFEGEQDVDMELAADLWDDILPSELSAIFEVIDTDKDLILSWEEMYSVDLLHLLIDFPYLLPEDVDAEYDRPREWESEYDAHPSGTDQWDDYDSERPSKSRDEL